MLSVSTTAVSNGQERRKSESSIGLPALRVSVVQDMRWVIHCFCVFSISLVVNVEHSNRNKLMSVFGIAVLNDLIFLGQF